MADIRPFSAYRPAPGMEGRIAALPYDVYNRQEATKEVRQNPDSFLAIDRAETGFGPEVDTYAPQVYERAAALLRDQIAQGKFVREDKPCYYLYELTMDGRSQTGIVACASIDDYSAGIIKKHENTRADKEQDRIRHVDVCDMQTGPIFLAYRACGELKKALEEGGFLDRAAAAGRGDQLCAGSRVGCQQQPEKSCDRGAEPRQRPADRFRLGAGGAAGIPGRGDSLRRQTLSRTWRYRRGYACGVCPDGKEPGGAAKSGADSLSHGSGGGRSGHYGRPCGLGGGGRLARHNVREGNPGAAAGGAGV